MARGYVLGLGFLAALPAERAGERRAARRCGARPRRGRWEAIASVAALTIFGTAMAQLVLYRLLRLYGSARTSLVTYLMPPTALLYGALLLDEAVMIAAIAGLLLILPGVALGSGALRLGGRAAATAAP